MSETGGPAVRSEPHPSISTGTPWVWLLACIPAVQTIALEPDLLGFTEIATSPTRTASDGTVDLLVAGFAIDFGVTLFVIVAAGLLAFLDERALQHRGVPRPFPWGWGFLLGVYLVGRTVVLRRRLGRGAAPLVLGASLYAAGMIVTFTQFLVVFAAALHAAPALG